MTLVDGGELVARSLARQGVTHLFGLGGGHINPTWWAAPRHGIRVIDVRHEAAATHCAEGWALATGTPGVAVVTGGTGTHERADRDRHRGRAAHPCRRVRRFGNVTRCRQRRGRGPRPARDRAAGAQWARRVYHLDRIPEYVARAFVEATTGTPGPVYLELAIDLIHSQIDDTAVEEPTLLTRSATAVEPASELIDVCSTLAIVDLPEPDRPVKKMVTPCRLRGGKLRRNS